MSSRTVTTKLLRSGKDGITVLTGEQPFFFACWDLGQGWLASAPRRLLNQCQFVRLSCRFFKVIWRHVDLISRLELGAVLIFLAGLIRRSLLNTLEMAFLRVYPGQNVTRLIGLLELRAQWQVALTLSKGAARHWAQFSKRHWVVRVHA